MTPRFDAIGIVVQDMRRTLDFYCMLGLEFDDGAEDEGHVETVLPGGIRLMFDTLEVVESFTTYEAPTGYRMGLAFLCADPAEVDAVHGNLVAAGHRSRIEPFDAFWGQRYATGFDPDDNPVDLFAPL